MKYKRNLINNLLHRANQICSNTTLIHKEFAKITSALQQNGYLERFINKQIARFLNKNQNPKLNASNLNPTNCKRIFLKLPYVRKISTQIEKRNSIVLTKT